MRGIFIKCVSIEEGFISYGISEGNCPEAFQVKEVTKGCPVDVIKYVGGVMKGYLFGLGKILVGGGLMFIFMYEEVNADIGKVYDTP